VIETYRDHTPVVDETAFVHDDAVLIGDVRVGARSSIWPGVVLRGDQGFVHIGEETSIQDGSIGHATGGVSTTSIGSRCTVGHRALLHGCTVEDDCLIGMGAILMDNCIIGRESIVGAGALVPPGCVILPRSLVMGMPAKVVRQLTDEDVEKFIRHGTKAYLRLCAEYLEKA
jgi:carbonic anhydrase/acetyltransferase-like protein (isoleucine patch superfamily)